MTTNKTSYSSLMDFNKLNSDLYQLSSNYRFSKKPNEFDRGYLKISDWLGDMCFHYERKRKHFKNLDESEFLALVKEHKEKILELEESDYKSGLLKAINEIKQL